ncbi:hypothetical protein yinte0001_2610 [Yersinia intermedia ATCC 29909]|nr:hypothetical protein yinte0001_2610 [Yersinia intermedia ATCC 29909]
MNDHPGLSCRGGHYYIIGQASSGECNRWQAQFAGAIA